MRELQVDFNARTSANEVSLRTRGAERDLLSLGLKHRDWAWITDGEVRVGAQIRMVPDEPVAQPVWETLEEIVSHHDVAEFLREHGDQRVSLKNARKRGDWARFFELLPYVEPHMTPGAGFFLRARAAEELGYPALALVASQAAVQASPNDPKFQFFRLISLAKVAPKKAIENVRTLARQTDVHGLLVSGCSYVIVSVLPQLSPTEASKLRLDLLEITRNFERARGFRGLPQRARANVFISRALAYEARGELKHARGDLSRAIVQAPRLPLAYALRGAIYYPESGSLEDLLHAITLGIEWFVPGYLLAHSELVRGDWAAVRTHARSALSHLQPNLERAELLTWLAIAEFELGGTQEKAHTAISHALTLNPSSGSIQTNLQIMREAREPAGWSISSPARPVVKHYEELIVLADAA